MGVTARSALGVVSVSKVKVKLLPVTIAPNAKTVSDLSISQMRKMNLRTCHQPPGVTS